MQARGTSLGRMRATGDAGARLAGAVLLLVNMTAAAQPMPLTPGSTLVSGAERGNQPAVAASPDGSFVVAWSRYGVLLGGLAARKLDAAGGVLGPMSIVSMAFPVF